MVGLSPYREAAPRPVARERREWCIRKPYTRSMVRTDIILIGCWAFCSIIDVLRIALEGYRWGWGLLGLHLFCVAGWALNLWLKVERRVVRDGVE